MNPVKEIGRYQIPILSVLAIKKRSGWRAWLKPGYDVMLNNGAVFHFTEEEKEALDKAVEEHAVIMQVWGMCKSAGLRA
jgi:hypothetical protein